MNLGDRLQAATAKAQARRAILGSLEKLPVGERADLLIEILAEIDPSALSAGDTGTKHATNGHSRRRRIRKGKGAKSETLIAMLREKPGRPIAEMAQEIYGDAGRDTQAKTRSLMVNLAKTERIRPVPGGAAGQWEAVS